MAAMGGDDTHSLDDIPEDPLLSLLTSKVTLNGEWKLEGEPTCRQDCGRRKNNSGYVC